MDPIKIEVLLKADQTLVDLIVYFGQCLIGAQKGPVEPKEKKPRVRVKPEGEIPATVVKHEEKDEEVKVTEGQVSPFDGVDEENSVDLSDLDEPKKEEPTPADAPSLTHEDARAAIKKARDRGINASQVKAIITGMGYDVLDAVPVEKLPEFISKVEAL